MNAGFLIETSVIIAYLKDLEKGVKLAESLVGPKFSSVVCLGELYEGVFLVKKEDSLRIKKGIENFFRNLDGTLPVTEKMAKVFGEIRAKLRQKGEIISDLDILIASSCLAEHLTLVTLNYKHFQRIPGLKIYS